MKTHKLPSFTVLAPGGPAQAAPVADLSATEAMRMQAAFGNSFVADQRNQEGDGGFASEDPSDEPEPRRCQQRPTVLCRCSPAERENQTELDCSRIKGWSSY